MKVIPKEEMDGLELLIQPETEFEEHYLRNFHNEDNLLCFLKHGVTIKDCQGLIIRNKK